MKASDLRIGNWVQRLDGSKFQIRAQDFDFIENVRDFLKPKPIELTPEILEKAGLTYYEIGGSSTRFKYKEGYYSLCNTLGEVFLENNGNGFSVQTITYYHADSTEIAFVKYLHELQNLYFALTHQELNINL